ncbi:GntR family transcriptional regulator [Enterococcus sp. AZ126]|uniref:GntR family transcriptional regulator n=1 Tax=Enterococcus sp. AZ126 TaxID=2774635 RepID=UPI003F1E4B3E
MSRYKEVADDIRAKIISGFYNSEKSMPEQVVLAKEYKTSRMTIQKALEILRIEGLVYSRRGSGTFVRKNARTLSELDSKADIYNGVTKHLGSKGKITSKIISFSIRFPNEIECEKLMIDPSKPVYDIIRLRYFKGEPLLLEYTIMPIEVITGITEKVLYHSIYSHIEDVLGLGIGVANRRIHADRPNENDKKYLECEEIDPILEVDQVVFLDSGVPFEYSQTRHRYDKGDIVVVNLNAKRG